MSTDLENLEKLFGSGSRVEVLRLLLNNPDKQFRVNEVVRKAGINGRLASVELKKLAEIGILSCTPSGNSLLYQANNKYPWVSPLREIFIQRNWSEWERPSRIHHLILTFEGALAKMKDYYGYCLSECYLVFDYDNVSLLFNIKDFREIGRKLVPIYQKKRERIWADFEKYAATLGEHKDYKSFYKNYVDFWKVAYITEPVSFYIDGLLAPDETITIGGKSFTEDYENRIWDLAKQAQEVGLDKVNIKPILSDYFWIRNNYHTVRRLTEEEVKTEIKGKLGKSRLIPTPFKEPTSIPADILAVGRDIVLMQDKRKMYMMKAAHYLHNFLKDIGEECGLSPQLMDQTLPAEVLGGKKVLAKMEDELKIRQRACTVICDLSKGIKAFSGQQIFPESVQQQAKLEVRGNSACGGKAVGRAKIVKGAQTDLYKVNHGDIIVSPMTTPDFIPALRRCAGIVTDFGGITCHAAIVAREFNIPCIVGTRDATAKIKDNDLVEVDANNGVVRVLASGV